MRILRPLCVAAFFLAAMLLAGCGGMAEVKGTVKFDGKLIENGTIRFEPADGKSQPTGAPITSGEYSAKVPVGDMKVSISYPKIVGKKKLYEDDPMSPYGDFTIEVLPAKYFDFMKTELKFEVKPGVNPKDWDLAK